MGQKLREGLTGAWMALPSNSIYLSKLWVNFDLAYRAFSILAFTVSKWALF